MNKAVHIQVDTFALEVHIFHASFDVHRGKPMLVSCDAYTMESLAKILERLFHSFFCQLSDQDEWSRQWFCCADDGQLRGNPSWLSMISRPQGSLVP